MLSPWAGVDLGQNPQALKLDSRRSLQTTDALRKTANLLVEEHEKAELKVTTYRKELEKSQDYLARLEAAYSKLCTQNASLRCVCSTDHKKLTELSTQVLQDQKHLDTLSAATDDLNSQLAEIKADRDQLLNDLTMARKRTKEVSDDLALALIRHVEKLRTDLSQAIDNRTQLEASKTELSDKVKQLDTRLGAEKEAHHQQVAHLTTELDSTREMHASKAKEAAALTIALAFTKKSTSTKLEELNRKLDAATAVADGLSAELSEAMERANDLQSDLITEQNGRAVVEEELSRVKAAQAQLEEDFLELLEKHLTTEDAFETKSSEYAALLKNHTDLQLEFSTTNDSHQAELKQLQDSLSAEQTTAAAATLELQATITQLTSSLTQAQEEASKTKDEAVKALKSVKEAGEQEMNIWRERAREELDGIMNRHKAEMETVGEEMKKLTLELEESKNALETLRKEHEAAVKQAEDNEKKRDQEVGKLECRLDEVNNSWNLTQSKLDAAQTELKEAAKNLQNKDAELAEVNAALSDLQLQFQQVQGELEAKRQLLHGISAVAAQGEANNKNNNNNGGGGSQPSAVKKKTRKPHTTSAPDSSVRPSKRVHFQQPIAVTQDVEEEEEEDDEEDIGGNNNYTDWGNDFTAADDAEEEEDDMQQQNQHMSQALVVHKQPIIEEPSDSEADEAEQFTRPKASKIPRKTIAAPPRHKPTAPLTGTGAHSSRRMGAMLSHSPFVTNPLSSQQDFKAGKKGKASKKASKGGSKKERGGGSREMNSKKKGNKADVSNQFASVFSLFGGLATAYSPDSPSV